MRDKIAIITQRLRLPVMCALCNQYHRKEGAICTSCQHLITPIGPACRYCALPLPDTLFLVCGHCCRQKPDVDLVMTAYCFDEPLRTLIHEFKYKEGLYLTSFLVNLMLDAHSFHEYKTDCLIPIPMHHKRLRERGFNQAALLTTKLGQHLKLPIELDWCKKIINTVPQAGLDEKERKQNLRHAFQALPKPYQHVTLIDDLFTTGSTANELARTLKNQGISRVDVWCCARVVPKFLSTGYDT